MKFRLIWVTIFFSIISTNINAKNGFQVENGILELTQVNIEDYKSIKLEGSWEFYWNQLLEPKDFAKKTIKPDYVSLPKSWTSYVLDSTKLPNKGYATYRLTIHKKPDAEETIYGLKISSVFCNYKLWVNGQFLSEVGELATEKAKSKPQFKYQDVCFILDPDDGATDKIEIVFQVSNFSHQRAGLQKPVYFGTYSNLAKESRWMDILNLIIVGIILVIGINHLNMFFTEEKMYLIYISVSFAW